MNNRDPFNVRRAIGPVLPTPFENLLQQGVNLSRQVAEAGQEVLTTTKHALEQTVSEFQSGQSVSSPGGSRTLKARSSDEDMSFAVPKNVPDFEDPARGMEDKSWGAGGRQRITGQVFGNGAEKKGLPMYKDKPYNYAPSSRKGAWWRRRGFLAFVAAILLLWFWRYGGIFGGSQKPRKERGSSNLFGSGSRKLDWSERRDSVRDAFKISWAAYEKYAWGYDEYKPKSKQGRQMVPPNGLGWIIIDSLDTMMLMNLTTELAHAREWITEKLDYNVDHDVSTFETTIRMLGGLLSANYLSTEFPDMAPVPLGLKGEDLYVEKAVDLADRLLGAYDSPSGIPWASVNLKTIKGIESHADGGASSTAEATSLQLEMKYLAKLTGETQYWEKAEKIMKVVDDNAAQDGLVPIFIYADKGTFRGSNIRLGSRGDSYYEYLIKQYMQTNKQEPVYRHMWEEALKGIRKHLLTFSSPSNFLVLAERPDGLDRGVSPKMDHLVCFLPGTIALSVTGGATVEESKKSRKWTAEDEENMHIAEELMKTCWGMYKATATGLAPEIAHFQIHEPPLMYEDFAPGKAPKSPSNADMNEKGDDVPWKQDYVIKAADTHNLQRPETVESLFYMYRITGDDVYRQWGWEMFQSFVNYTRLDDGAGFSSIRDVTKTTESGHGWRDNMESFWLAETLKYLYLLFSPPSFLPLDSVVFNTEAHPFPRFDTTKTLKTGWTRKPRNADGEIEKAETKKAEPPAPMPTAKATSKEAAAEAVKATSVKADKEEKSSKTSVEKEEKPASTKSEKEEKPSATKTEKDAKTSSESVKADEKPTKTQAAEEKKSTKSPAAEEKKASQSEKEEFKDET